MNKIETKDQLFDLIFKTIEERRLVYVSVQDVLTALLRGHGGRYFANYDHIEIKYCDEDSTSQGIFKLDDVYFSGIIESDSYGSGEYAIPESIKVVTPVTKNVTTYE